MESDPKKLQTFRTKAPYLLGLRVNHTHEKHEVEKRDSKRWFCESRMRAPLKAHPRGESMPLYLAPFPHIAASLLFCVSH